jgi:hypothetical protein
MNISRRPTMTGDIGCHRDRVSGRAPGRVGERLNDPNVRYVLPRVVRRCRLTGNEIAYSSIGTFPRNWHPSDHDLSISLVRRRPAIPVLRFEARAVSEQVTEGCVLTSI